MSDFLRIFLAIGIPGMLIAYAILLTGYRMGWDAGYRAGQEKR